MNKKELAKMYKEKRITKEVYMNDLFELEQQPKKVRKATREYDPVTMDEFKKLLKTTKNIKHALSFMLGMGSGLRLSEIVGGIREDGSEIPALTRENVDIKSKIIQIRQAKGRKDRKTNVPKWFKEKHLKHLPIKLGHRAIEKAFLKNSLECGINSIIGYYERKNKDGVMQEVPIYRLKFHSLRRGFATELNNSNVPIGYIKIFMGHSNIATTSRYIKPKISDDGIINKVMDGFN